MKFVFPTKLLNMISPPFSDDYSSTANAINGVMTLNRGWSDYVQYTSSGATVEGTYVLSLTSGQTKLAAQFMSLERLAPQTFLTTHEFTLCIYAISSGTLTEPDIRIKVVSADGQITRGTLYSSAETNESDITPEGINPTTGIYYVEPLSTIHWVTKTFQNQVTALEGDRIAFELGAFNGAGSGRTVKIYCGQPNPFVNRDTPNVWQDFFGLSWLRIPDANKLRYESDTAKFYLPYSGTPLLSPSYSSDWSTTAQAQRLPMSLGKSNTWVLTSSGDTTGSGGMAPSPDSPALVRDNKATFRRLKAKTRKRQPTKAPIVTDQMLGERPAENPAHPEYIDDSAWSVTLTEILETRMLTDAEAAACELSNIDTLFTFSGGDATDNLEMCHFLQRFALEGYIRGVDVLADIAYQGGLQIILTPSIPGWGEGYVGLSGQGYVYFQDSYWWGAGDAGRLALFYHEFGHELLNLSGDDGANDIMGGRPVLSGSQILANYTWLMNDLYGNAPNQPVNSDLVYDPAEFPSASVPDLPTPPGGGDTTTGGGVYNPPETTPYTQKNGIVAATSQSVLFRQYISDETLEQQTILTTDSFSLNMVGLCPGGAFRYDVRLKIVSNDGLTERGTLYSSSGLTEALVGMTSGGSTAMSSGFRKNFQNDVSCLEGDRLVFELGVKNVSGATATAYLYPGDMVAYQDLAEVNGWYFGHEFLDPYLRYCPWLKIHKKLALVNRNASVAKESASKVYRRLMIKRRSEITGLFEADWQDISSYVIRWGTVSLKSETDRPGKVVVGGLNLVLDNTTGKFDPNTEGRSLWYGYLDQQRTLVKIESGFIKQTKGTDGIWVNTYYPPDDDFSNRVFTGIISGNIFHNDDLQVTIPIQPLTALFKDYPTSLLSPTTVNTFFSWKWVQMLRDHTDGSGNFVFRPFFGNTSTGFQISRTPYARATLQTTTSESLDGKTLIQALEQGLQLEMKATYVDQNGIFRFSDFEPCPISKYKLVGGGAFDPIWGQTIIDVSSAGIEDSQYYSGVSVQYDPNPVAPDIGKIVTMSSLVVGGDSDAWEFGQRLFEVDAGYDDVEPVRELASNLMAIVSERNSILEVKTTFLPFLKIFDRVSVYYGPVGGGGTTLWDEGRFDDNFYWDRSSLGDGFKKQGGEYQIVSISIDLENFTCSLKLREL